MSYTQSGTPNVTFQATPASVPPASAASAMGAGWNESFLIVVPPASQWPSGLYVARVTAPTGYAYDVPFIVKPDPTSLSGTGRPGDIAVIANVNCWNAYNTWGGYSNYNAGQGRQLSHQRPSHHLLTAFTDHANGTHLLRGEIWVFEWLQQTYPSCSVHLYTDIDLHNGSVPLDKYKCVVFDTHPEYLSRPELDRLNTYVNNGGRLLDLGGNVAYRQTILPRTDDYPNEATTPAGTMTTTGKDGISTPPNLAVDDPDPLTPTNFLPLFGVTIGIYPGSGYGYFTVYKDDAAVFRNASGGTITTFGSTVPGWNNVGGTGSAAGWESDAMATPASDSPQTLLARWTVTNDLNYGCMTRWTPSTNTTGGWTTGGWSVGIASITLGGSLRVDGDLQCVVKNLLHNAGVG